LIAVVLAAGCGGQSADEQRAAWARDADAACAGAERAIVALQRNLAWGGASGEGQDLA
jgi:hypothetical protein